MKKVLSLLSIITLTACDKPTSTADLTCNLDKNWQRDNVEYAIDAEGHFTDTHDTKIDVRVTTYEDYADVTVDKITTKFEKVQEERYFGDFGEVNVRYKGNFPGSERTALLEIFGDITNRQILQYDFIFLGKRVGKYTKVQHSCHPVKEEYKGMNAAVPFNHHYKMPNKIERCINDIVKKAYFFDDERKISVYVRKRKYLTQEEALSISSNWDYSNMKFYENDGKLEEHEKDACEVLDRINKFIYDNDLDAHESKVVEKAYDECGDDCREIFVTGSVGDFINIIPETPEVKDLFNKKAKTVKFLSIENPKQYVKQGYCLVNMVPYDTMKKMGDLDKGCHYRIYCGTAEEMNYDQAYAIEICVR